MVTTIDHNFYFAFLPLKESLVADKKEPVAPAAPAPDMGGGMGMY